MLWEEVPFLNVEKTGKPVAIYKREDVQKDLPLEQRNYYAHFPIRGTRGKRMSLLVSEREDALMRVQEEAVNLRVQLAQGVTVVIKTTVEDLVAKFLAYKWMFRALLLPKQRRRCLLCAAPNASQG